MIMDETQIDTHLKDERAFIHDLATPLMIAMGMVESTMNKTEDEAVKQKLGKASQALGKMNDILKSRREVLIGIMSNDN